MGGLQWGPSQAAQTAAACPAPFHSAPLASSAATVGGHTAEHSQQRRIAIGHPHTHSHTVKDAPKPACHSPPDPAVTTSQPRAAGSALAVGSFSSVSASCLRYRPLRHPERHLSSPPASCTGRLAPTAVPARQTASPAAELSRQPSGRRERSRCTDAEWCRPSYPEVLYGRLTGENLGVDGAAGYLRRRTGARRALEQQDIPVSDPVPGASRIRRQAYARMAHRVEDDVEGDQKQAGNQQLELGRQQPARWRTEPGDLVCLGSRAGHPGRNNNAAVYQCLPCTLPDVFAVCSGAQPAEGA